MKNYSALYLVTQRIFFILCQIVTHKDRETKDKSKFMYEIKYIHLIGSNLDNLQLY